MSSDISADKGRLDAIAGCRRWHRCGRHASAKYKKALSKCSTAHLLCAEDNLFNVEVLRAFVSGSKMRMTTVEDGKQALEAYTAA